MTRALVIAMGCSIGCSQGAAPARSDAQLIVVPAPPSGRAPVPAEPIVRTTTQRESDGRCDPLPREGSPCEAGDSWCIVDWGSPGGSSTALWCRGGRWEVEEERNLPADGP